MRRVFTSTTYLCIALGALPVGAHAQVVVRDEQREFRLEGFANLTLGLPAGEDTVGYSGTDDLRLDGALRLFARQSFGEHSGVGARVVVQSSPEKRLGVGEASAIVFGRWGRLEVGKRMGLPDVLAGYAPNPFTFTSADFGPASGASLDPAGNLQTLFLGRTLASQINALSPLGFTAALADDQSAKAVFVSPKKHGLLAGLSYSANPEDARFGNLIQAGLVREWYWSQNVLRFGGSYTSAAGQPGPQRVRALRSINVGVSASVNDALSLGASVTFNGTGGLPAGITPMRPAGAVGATVSANYNTGPWTVGAYLQRASSEGEVDVPGSDRLQVAEVGASYRFTTHWRIYGAAYLYDFIDEGGNVSQGRFRGSVWLIGIRAQL